MYQGTTPTMQFVIPGKNLTDKRVYFTLEDKSRQKIVTWKSGDEGFIVEYNSPNTTLLLQLTQEQTFDLPLGTIYAQARWIGADGQAWATEQCSFTVKSVLLNEVISYGD